MGIKATENSFNLNHLTLQLTAVPSDHRMYSYVNIHFLVLIFFVPHFSVLQFRWPWPLRHIYLNHKWAYLRYFVCEQTADIYKIR